MLRWFRRWFDAHAADAREAAETERAEAELQRLRREYDDALRAWESSSTRAT